MSKSLGNVLDPFEVMDRFGTDALRYYCFREVSFGQDGGVSTITFGERYETELANELGNLASRTLNMLGRYRDGAVPGGRRRPGARRRTSTACARRSASCSTRPEITQALERIWQRVRRLNRYVEEQRAVAARQGRGEGRTSCDATLRSLAEGLRVVTVLLDAVHPRVGGEAARTRSARRTASLEAARLRRAPGRQRGREARAAVPQAGSDRQPHPPRPRARARGRAGRRGARGRRQAHPHDRHRRASPAAPRSPPPRPTPRSSRRSATTRTRRPATTTRSRTSCASWRAPDAACAIGETGLDDYRDYAPRADQERAFRAQIELAREIGKPLVIHTRAAEDDTIATLAARRARASRSSCTASRCPTGSRSASSTAGGSRSPATSPTRRRSRPGGGRRAASRSTACWSRPTRPYLTPQVVRKERNRPAYVVHTARFIAERRGIAYEELEAAVEANAARLFGW